MSTKVIECVKIESALSADHLPLETVKSEGDTQHETPLIQVKAEDGVEKSPKVATKTITFNERVGIENEGHTCFLNSVVQLLVSAPKYREALCRTWQWNLCQSEEARSMSLHEMIDKCKDKTENEKQIVSCRIVEMLALWFCSFFVFDFD